MTNLGQFCDTCPRSGFSTYRPDLPTALILLVARSGFGQETRALIVVLNSVESSGYVVLLGSAID